MLKRSLNGLDKKKLKRWILLFFFALAIPTAFLIQQAYSRLKWETFHQHQLMADELTNRIDNQLLRLIDSEEKRSFTDYSFLNIAGNPKANLLQRSPLSKFPVESEIPGIIGFFQVDNKGELMTPFIPEGLKSGKSAQSYGIGQQELSSRLALQNQIQDILSQNNLVKNQDKMIARETDNNKTKISKRDESAGSLLGSLVSKSRSKENRSQIAFDKLKKAPSEYKRKRLKTDSTKSFKKSAKKIKNRAAKQMKKEVRIEQNVLPESELTDYSSSYDSSMEKRSLAQASPASSVSGAYFDEEKVVAQLNNQPVRIRTFESSIDPFYFSQLDSGHFVLFRNVWLNDKRYIQGILFEQQAFLDKQIGDNFKSTSLSDMSDCLVTYQGNELTVFSNNDTPNRIQKSLNSPSELTGELLYQARLSDPLSNLQLHFTVNQLPIGAGGNVIIWLSILLTSILCIGFYLMYRLGLSQINLAQQQQDFVSAVSHELKTPLTSIRMYGEMLREGWASEEKKKRYYDFIYDESERLTRLINNVLHLARMTRNEHKANIKQVSVSALMDEVQSKVSTQIKQADFSLAMVCDENLKTSEIKIDEDWFIQIMINLVDNAIKFSSKSTTKQVDIHCYKESKGRIEFSVRDYGEGIDKQQMKKIFKLFYRSENELTRETVGTGIGLALVHQMVFSMGGEIDVVNQTPGVQFKIVFSAEK